MHDIYYKDYGSDSVGFKINYSQINKYEYIYDWIKQNNIKIIQLVRYNLLKRLASHKIANIRNIRHSKSEIDPIKIKIDPKYLLDDFNRREKRFEKFRKRFTDELKVPYLEIVYESMRINYEKEIKKTLKFLNVDYTLTVKSDFVKVNPDKIQDIIEKLGTQKSG